jgi:hypothetical protein
MILCVTKARNSKRCVEWGADEALIKESLDPQGLAQKTYSLLGLAAVPSQEKNIFEHKRRWPRLPIHLPLKIGVYPIRTPYRRDSGKALMENIGVGGAYLSGIQLDGHMLPCEPFRISLESDQEPLKNWRAHCRVVRLQSNGTLSAGVQFTRVPKTSLKLIQELIA